MAGRNRDRRRAERRRELEQAVIALQRRDARRRRLVFGGSILLAVAAFAIAALILSGGDDGESVNASRDTTTSLAGTTTTAAVASAAGKPCVPVAEPLPAGAPAVPVKVGPPPTALLKEDLKAGTGAEVKASDTVTAHYIGVACSTGKIFDSSYSRGEPSSFPLSDVIPGWQQGLPGMKVGGQRLLGIPAEMAYGKDGRPPTILGDEALWFVVEITDTKAS